MEFTSILESSGGNKAGFVVPDAVVDGLGGGKRPKVAVTVAGYTYRSSIARMGERYMVGMSIDRRAEAGVTVGDTYDVDIVLDDAPREVDLPPDLAAALDAVPAAKEFWQTLSHSKQQWHVLQVTGAKKPETRAKRVETSVSMLAEGRAR
ncbi:YdeI/OmpD-associated family protein [Jiangella mangrovi]|uniref:DUF1905 domain-containing protein n=1 Tax=Jiangella mangrovi TaxID=1524084 RepID=A0A7W9GKU6_9ACTN|nr:hypothetical protein [Jiangella mangrovi]